MARLYNGSREQFLQLKVCIKETCDFLRRQGVLTLAVDNLAYTQEFERIYAIVRGNYPRLGRRGLLRMLLAPRKAGKKFMNAGIKENYDDIVEFN
jgi:hypothetical protein